MAAATCAHAPDPDQTDLVASPVCCEQPRSTSEAGGGGRTADMRSRYGKGSGELLVVVVIQSQAQAWVKAARPADASEIAFTRPLFMSMVFFAGLAPLKTGAYGAHSTRAIVRAFAPAQRCRVRALCAYLASEVSL